MKAMHRCYLYRVLRTGQRLQKRTELEERKVSGYEGLEHPWILSKMLLIDYLYVSCFILHFTTALFLCSVKERMRVLII
uniref:Uncharacterized protein n=1 Tax=Lotus japonicus TaxID=34305 RepID=I3SCU1_LOTJA|nr:unknown [Lotus japonicus]